MGDRFDLTGSPLAIPARFADYRYHPSGFPNALNGPGGTVLANCQTFAFDLLRHFGITLPRLRSSEIVGPESSTIEVDRMQPLDLVLLHRTAATWGAHVVVALADGLVVHLSRSNGAPAIESTADLLARPEYRMVVGIRRARELHNTPQPERSKVHEDAPRPS